MTSLATISNGQAATIIIQEVKENTFEQKSTEERNQDQQEDKNKSKKVGYWGWFHVITILVVCALALAIQTLIPRQNLIY